MGEINWVHDLHELQAFAREDIIPAWRADGPHPTRDWPKYTWLTENGYSHLKWILEEKHDLTLSAFFRLIVNAGNPDTYQWDIEDAVTTKQLVKFLDRITETRELDETTRDALRAKLNTLLGMAADEWGDAKFYQAAHDESLANELYELFERVVLKMKGNRPDDSTRRYLRVVQRWYEWLTRRHLIEYNPIEGLQEEFRWEQDTSVRPLTDAEVSALWEAADEIREYMVIVGYVLWGLRTSELPAIHVSQLNLDDEDPHIAFEDRKNGPGTVSVQLGFSHLKAWLSHRKNHADFDGTLFDESPGALRDLFNEVAARADVRRDEDPANPTSGRKYWNERYTEANLFMIEASAEIIPDRGSKDPKVAVEYYTSEELRRKYRRYISREHLKNVLPEDAIPEEEYISDITDQQRLATELQDDIEEYIQNNMPELVS